MQRHQRSARSAPSTIQRWPAVFADGFVSALCSQRRAATARQLRRFHSLTVNGLSTVPSQVLGACVSGAIDARAGAEPSNIRPRCGIVLTTALKTTDRSTSFGSLAAPSRSGILRLCGHLHSQLSRDFFQKTQSDLTSTASARVRRRDCRGECLLVRVKVACASTGANLRI
jgi:hypothetical protein